MMTIRKMVGFKPFSFQSSSKCPSILIRNPCSKLLNPNEIFSKVFCSQNSTPTDDVEKVFGIITSSSSNTNLKQSLSESGVFLSNDLIDEVLNRMRFSGGNPLQALDFFNYTSKRKGFCHTPSSLNTLLYILGGNRKFDQIWEVLKEAKRKDKSLISPRTVQVVLARIAKVCSIRQTVESFRKFRKLVPEFDTSCFNALLRSLFVKRRVSRMLGTCIIV